MDDFPGLLAKDFGFRPQGKSAPMAASKGTGGTINYGIGSGSGADTISSSFSSNQGKSGGGTFFDDHDGLFGSTGNQKTQDYKAPGGYSDVFGGPPKYTNRSDGRSGTSSSSSFDYDSIFHGSKDSGAKSSSLPVYDKPLYDDDIFEGVPGLKNSTSVKYNDVFSSISSPRRQSTPYDDLLGNLGRAEPELKSSSGKRSVEVEKDVSVFDDLIPGFGGSSPPKDRSTSETSRVQSSTVPSTKSTSSVLEDPFVVLESTSVPAYASSGLFSDPLEQINKSSNSGNTKVDVSSVSGVFNDTDPLDSLAKSVPLFSSDLNNRGKDKSPLRTGPSTTTARTSAGNEPTEKPSMKPAENASQTKVDMPPKSEENLEAADYVWLTVFEIPLFTQPTSAPPPSRPPPRPAKVSKADKGSFSAVNSKKANDSSFHYSTQNSQSSRTVPDSVKSSGVSSMDELEDFAMGRPPNIVDEHDVLSSEEEVETNSAAAASAAAMKEAMDRAEAKFKHAREVRERENARAARSREASQQEKEEKVMQDAQEQELREKQERLEHEREQREREEKEREQRRLEKERERAREIERERGKARQAVERATREARERAAADARLKAERAAVDKVNAGARERAERAAVQRAQAEARERAAAEARDRAERAAAEAKERAHAEATEKSAAEAREKAAVARAEAEVRLRAERAAADRAAAEARERAAAVARERAAAARDNQQKNGDDLESFFGMGARPNSAPRSRTTSSDSAFDAQFQNRAGPDVARRTSVGTSSSMRKASSTTNIVDDLTSIFGAAPSSGEFQVIDGESEERRRARLVRHQRTQERAQQALAEKNQRDLQIQRDQAERHRISETLDLEIQRWATGKEGNMRALLSTLHNVLWPECGWQPVSLADLITAASVKKVYRKATLSVHPDKVQQKGANLQQKYIAEKVFDLLKEAWNKFNSEELF